MGATTAVTCANRMRAVSHALLYAALIAVTRITYNAHYAMPIPLDTLYSQDGQPQFSERQALEYVRALAEDIGYRIVGTREHLQSRDWLKQQIERLQDDVENDQERCAWHKVEVSYQIGSGAHRFDFMGKIVMKQYAELQNVVVRISSHDERSRDNAILVNAHLDSTLPSPGAADDGLGIAIELEMLRILTSRKAKLHNAVILLFNDAEESLQDASHLFATQHEWASTVRGVVNLEAAGTTGPEIVFQATSPEMIQAYAQVPHPYGTVLASDVFATGLILSDTDFRQFERYGNLTGLDMAVVGNSYAYHTRLDTVDHIQPGVAQHFGENVLAILTHLTAGNETNDGPLVALEFIEQGHGTETVYFSVLHKWFVTYPVTKARLAAQILLASIVVYVSLTRPKPIDLFYGVALNIGGLLGALAASNLLALALTRFDLQMIWFKSEFSCLFIYLPSTLIGFIAPTLLITGNRHVGEQSHLAAAVMYSILSLFPIGSAFWMFWQSLALFTSILIRPSIAAGGGSHSMGTEFREIFHWTLAGCQAILFGAEAFFAVLDIFVPLTGRIGNDAPTDTIIASIVSILAFMTLPLLPSYVLAFSRTTRTKIVGGLLIACIAGIAKLSREEVFDALHPKRLFVQHMVNITSGETTLHMASADPAPGFPDLVKQVSLQLGAGGNITAGGMSDWISDWDTIYPFSQFLESWKIEIPSAASEMSLVPRPSIYATYSRTKTITSGYISEGGIQVAQGDRVAELNITISHPGLVWTIISFDAEVLEWSLPSPPPTITRHHVRQVAPYGYSQHYLHLKVRIPKEEIYRTGSRTKWRGLSFDFVGVDELGIYPAKKGQPASLTRDSMRIFEMMEGEDGFLKNVDGMMNGVVSGRFNVF